MTESLRPANHFRGRQLIWPYCYRDSGLHNFGNTLSSNSLRAITVHFRQILLAEFNFQLSIVCTSESAKSATVVCWAPWLQTVWSWSRPFALSSWLKLWARVTNRPLSSLAKTYRGNLLDQKTSGLVVIKTVWKCAIKRMCSVTLASYCSPPLMASMFAFLRTARPVREKLSLWLVTKERGLKDFLICKQHNHWPQVYHLNFFKQQFLLWKFISF